jgi:hypothetical protein
MKLLEPSSEIRIYRILTRIIAVVDVVLATLGFFFNPFNDEEYDVPFLYWKITITCFIFEIWMIVSIHLFVAAQKIGIQGNPGKSVKYCRYWLIVATLAFVIFEGIIVFPPGINRNPLSRYYLPIGIFVYRFFATLIVLKFKSKLSEYAKTVSSQLQDSLNKYPDVINSATITRCKCSCDSLASDSTYEDTQSVEAAGISSVDLLRLQSAAALDPAYALQLQGGQFTEDFAQAEQFVKGVHV